ncbi:MAG: SIS domain-containing protein [Thermoleophilaceae bacterium]
MSAARAEAGEQFFADQAEPLARLCHRMAERFARGGRLLATGGSPQARSDARHVAVEFVHPVIVGKRALPALALTGEGGPLERQVDLAAEADDMLMAFDGAGVALARERGCLTIAFEPVGAEWELVPPVEDPLVAQELTETAYHVLWELVHVFFEHRGLLEGREARTIHDSGASSFLYPFLGESETDLDAVLGDVRASVLAKAAEIDVLASETLVEGAEVIAGAATELRARLDRGGRLLALGNGGSATDAMDAVADMRCPPHGWRPRRALDLTEDSSVITAVANDVGIDAIFARQVIAHGRPEDMLLAQSTSGNSANVIEALAEARRRGLATVAMVGYDGGRIASDGLADFVVVTRSENIPRIQEAQASAWHRLRALVEDESAVVRSQLPGVAQG